MFIVDCFIVSSECFITTCYLFFFKQKTAYEMRISDWSSDVCSSDLREVVWLSVELRQHVLKQGGEVHGHGAAQRTPLPGALARLAQHREPVHLMPAQSAVQQRRDRRQQIAHRIVHAAAVRDRKRFV